MAETGRRMGRPSKGPRSEVRVRMPLPMRAVVEARAAQEGKTLTDWVVELLARETGAPSDARTEEALPESA